MDVWETLDDTLKKDHGILKRQWRKQVECVLSEMNEHDQAMLKELRRPANNKEVLLKELYIVVSQLVPDAEKLNVSVGTHRTRPEPPCSLRAIVDV